MQLFDPGECFPQNAGLAFSPDGRFLAVAARPSVLCVLDTQSNAVRRFTLPAGTFPLEGVAFTADGSAVAVPTLDAAGQWLQVFDAATGERRPGLQPADIRAVAAVPGGKVIFGARMRLANDRARTEILRWDAADLRPLPSFGGHAGRGVVLAVSADGSRAAAASRKYVRAWNVAGEKVPARASFQTKADGWVKTLALSRDGGLVAGTVLTRVVVWDGKTGEEKFRHARHKKSVRAVAFHPSRPLLLSGGNDGLVFAFDASTGQELRRLEWGVGPVAALAFAPDGLRCAAAGWKGKVVVWDVDG